MIRPATPDPVDALELSHDYVSESMRRDAVRRQHEIVDPLQRAEAELADHRAELRALVRLVRRARAGDAPRYAAPLALSWLPGRWALYRHAQAEVRRLSAPAVIERAA